MLRIVSALLQQQTPYGPRSQGGGLHCGAHAQLKVLEVEVIVRQDLQQGALLGFTKSCTNLLHKHTLVKT